MATDLPKIFAQLKSALTSSQASTADLTASVTEARQAEAAAKADLARLESERGAMLVASETKRAEHKASLAAAQDRLADATAFLEALQAKHRDTAAAEAQAERRAVYDAATATRDEAAARLAKEYPALAGKLRDLLRVVAEAELVVDDANSALPAGAEPIVGVEAMVRSRPAMPRKDLKSTTVKRWCRDGRVDRMLPEDRQHEVKRKPDGTGTIHRLTGAGGTMLVTRYEELTFRRTEYLPAMAAVGAESLFRSAALPSLVASDPAVLLPDDRWDFRAAEFLRRLEELKPVQVEDRAVRVELTPVEQGAKLKAVA